MKNNERKPWSFQYASISLNKNAVEIYKRGSFMFLFGKTARQNPSRNKEDKEKKSLHVSRSEKTMNIYRYHCQMSTNTARP